MTLKAYVAFLFWRILAKFEHSSSYYGEFSKNGCFTTRVMESVPMDQMTRY